MKVFLPVYNTALPNVLGDLEEAFVDHQQALRQALKLHAYTNGSPIYKDAKERMGKYRPAIRDNVIIHAKMLVEVFDIRGTDFIDYQLEISPWICNTVFHRGSEYEFLSGKWYERTWKKSAIKAPTKKHGLLFYKDWTSKHPTAGLTILTNKKDLRTLTYGMAVEKQAKQIINAANMHLKNLRADKTPDILTADKRGEHYDIIEDQFIRDRGLKINEAVKEILKEARLLMFCGPITDGDRRHFRKNGLFDVQKRLQLVVFQTRHDAQPVVMLDCDPRMLVGMGEEDDRGHNRIAAGLAGILDAYYKSKKL